MKNTKNIFSFYIRNTTGFSQVEVMVTILVISIVIMGVITTFGGIGKSLITSKTRTIANNLAQEKVEMLKNYSYARLLITTESDLTTYGYDNTNTGYTPETLNIGDAQFRRYSTVCRAHEETIGSTVNISTTSPDSADEGIKKIMVQVKWTESGQEKTLVLYNFKDDPNRTTLGGKIFGFVQNTSGVAISGARVEVIQNMNWDASTSTTGYYLIKTSATATLQIMASKDGYWRIHHQSKRNFFGHKQYIAAHGETYRLCQRLRCHQRPPCNKPGGSQHPAAVIPVQPNGWNCITRPLGAWTMDPSV